MSSSHLPERTTLVLPHELRAPLDRLAEAHDRSLGAEIRVAVREHLAAHEETSDTGPSSEAVRAAPHPGADAPGSRGGAGGARNEQRDAAS